MKKHIAVFMFLVLIVIITGCGRGGNTKGNETFKPGATPKAGNNQPSGDYPVPTEYPDEPGQQDPGETDNNSTNKPGETTKPAVKPVYYIKVNVVSQITTVYKKDQNGKLVPYKNMICSTGLPGNETPLGTFKIYRRNRWMFMVDKTYGQYAVRFNGQILFHSVTYKKMRPDTFQWEEYNKLGQPASHGCVRLKVIDVKWIYDNCPDGTPVEVYVGQPDPELHSKLMPNPLPPGTGWDPSDPDPRNPIDEDDIPPATPTPIHTSQPPVTETPYKTPPVTQGPKPLITLNGDPEVTAEVGSFYTDPGAKATDTTGADITGRIQKDDSQVNTFVIGDYTITYYVIGDNGSVAEVKRIIHIVDTTKPVITLSGSPEVTIEAGFAYKDEGAKATDNYDKDISVKIVVKNPVNTNVAGDYTIEYNVTDQSGNKAETVIRIVHVIEKSTTQKPTETPVG